MTTAPDTSNPNQLPDGTEFPFWDDRTDYIRTYHVAVEHADADDGNDGSMDAPWRTIQKAAETLQPGEEVVVHAGIYRETVQPVRGGNGPDSMIRYRAADEGDVVLTGSDIWKPQMDGQFTKEGWGNLWSAPLPLKLFKGMNPFQCSNLTRSKWFPWQERPMEELTRAFLRQGMLFQNGRRLTQVSDRYEMKEHDGTFWVDDRGMGLWVRLFGDVAPDEVRLEVSTRMQCFAPEEAFGWISVQGFQIQNCANGVPMPAFGALSSAGGHHWIVENNRLCDHNAVGMDFTVRYRLGQSKEDPVGGHRIRNNRIDSCGITGLCGVTGFTDSLVENNHITRIGGMNLEHCYEAAGIKFHFAANALIRNNQIGHMKHACGIWMDYHNFNCRIHDNTIEDVRTVLGGIYIEANLGTDSTSWVDGNRISNIRDNPPNDPPKDGIQGGMGISVDVSEQICVLNNEVEDCEHYGIACHRAQPDREIQAEDGAKRVSANTGHLVLGNQLKETKGLALEAEKGIRTDGAEADVIWFR